MKFRAGKSVERLHEAGEYAAVPFSFPKLNFLPFARSFIEEKCQRTGLRERDGHLAIAFGGTENSINRSLKLS